MHSLGLMLEALGFKMTYTSEKNHKLIRFLDMLISLFKKMRSVDLVLIDTYSTLNFYYALVISQLCRLFKIPYVLILHGGQLPNRLKHNPLYSRLMFKNSQVNVSPSKYLIEAFKSFGYENLKYIPNAIHLEEYPFTVRKIDQINMLWVRSFSKIYNPIMAVKVLQQLKEQGFDASLCMVGPDKDGSLVETKEMADNLGLNARFTGKLSRAEWVDLSKDYNVFINTTNHDNMPVSVMEAMALGLPIVSTKVGGIPYLIEDGVEGVLCSANNSDEMAKLIVSLAKDMEQQTTLTARARRKVEDYDWNIVKHKWLEVLK